MNTDRDKESKLIQRCIDNDEDAWNDFVHTYGPVIHRVVAYRLYRMIGSNADYTDGENIFQEILMGLYAKGAKKLRNFTFSSTFSGWLAVIANRATIDYIRKERSRGRFSRLVYSRDSELPFNEFVNALYEQQIENEIIQSKIEDVKDVIASLPLKEQMIIQGIYFKELKHWEVAEILNLPYNSISPTLSRIIKKLRVKLGKNS